MLATDLHLDAAVLKVARHHLATLVEGTEGVVMALLATGDGRELLAHPRATTYPRLAAMTSSLHALADAMVREAGLSASREVIIQCEGGTVLVLGAGSLKEWPLAVIVVAHREILIGSLLAAARACSAGLQTQIQSLV